MKRIRQLQHRLLSERIAANERLQREEAKHERRMRRINERFIARESKTHRRNIELQYAKDRQLDDEHFERLNNADVVASKIAEEVKLVAKDTAANTITRERYEIDRIADQTARELERETQRLRDANIAAHASLAEGRVEGRKQLIAFSADTLRIIYAIIGISVAALAIRQYLFPHG